MNLNNKRHISFGQYEVEKLSRMEQKLKELYLTSTSGLYKRILKEVYMKEFQSKK